MTRARTASYGVVTPPPFYRWIDAVLMLCVSLVQGAVSTLKMIVVRCTRECHTKAPHADLPHATNSIHAPKPVLRGDCFAIPPDEASGRSTKESEYPHTHVSTQALILRGFAAIRVADELVHGDQFKCRSTRCANRLEGRGRAHGSVFCKRGTRVPGAGRDPVSAQRADKQHALSPLIPTNVGVNDGAKGAIWSGGPNRGVNASAEAQGDRQTLSRFAASIPRAQHNRSWIPTFVGMSGDGSRLKSA